MAEAPLNRHTVQGGYENHSSSGLFMADNKVINEAKKVRKLEGPTLVPYSEATRYGRALDSSLSPNLRVPRLDHVKDDLTTLLIRNESTFHGVNGDLFKIL